MLLSSDSIVSATALLSAEDFHRPAHGHVFDAVVSVHAQGEPADSTTVADELRRAGFLEEVGGSAALMQLQADCPAISNAPSYARIVADHATLRRLIGAAAEIAEMSYEAPDDVGAAVERAQATVAEVAGRTRGVRRAIATKVSTVEPERVRFLWPGRIPLGKVTVLDGDPGLGKSTVMLDVGARVTTGSPMPECNVPRDPAGVVLLSAEDGIGDTIRPRLEAAGADCDRVVVLEGVIGDDGLARLPSLPSDTKELGPLVAEVGAALVVVDPLMAYLDQRVDAHRDQDVRGALHRMAKLAESSGAAVLVIRHLTKTPGGSPLYRGGGSIGIIGASRSGLLVGVDPEDERRRVLAVSKANLAEKPSALAYRLVPAEEWGCVKVAWEGTTGYRAEELVGLVAKGEDEEEAGAVADACDFLREVLGDGDRWVAEVKDEAKAASAAWRTVERAKVRLHVTSYQVGGPHDPERGWKWHLPPQAAK